MYPITGGITIPTKLPSESKKPISVFEVRNLLIKKIKEKLLKAWKKENPTPPRLVKDTSFKKFFFSILSTIK